MDFISILRFFATILITNSHFGDLYPSGYSSLATGGMIGNALFFFCSGYTLYLSIIKRQQQTHTINAMAGTIVAKGCVSQSWSFLTNIGGGGYKWLLKRVLRIYPSVWIFRIFSYLFMGASFKWISLIIPGFWFLNAIILFYFIFYFIIRYYERYINLIIIILIIPFVVIFFLQQNRFPDFIMEETSNPYYLHYFYLFSIMLFGACVAQKRTAIHFSNKDWMKLLIVIFLYYSCKGIIIKYTFLWSLQLILPLLLSSVVFYAYKFSNKLINVKLFKNHQVMQIVLFISNLTLDIYIVQFTCIRFAQSQSFPIGYLEAIGLILLSAIILYYLSKKSYNFLIKNLKLNT